MSTLEWVVWAVLMGLTWSVALLYGRRSRRASSAAAEQLAAAVKLWADRP